MAVTTPATIPVLDLGAYLRGDAGALERAAAELHDPLEGVGFYFIVEHGMPWRLVDTMFAEARRVHALPVEQKLALRLSRHNTGYLPLASSVSRASAIDPVKTPNLVEVKSGDILKRWANDRFLSTQHDAT